MDKSPRPKLVDDSGLMLFIFFYLSSLAKLTSSNILCVCKRKKYILYISPKKYVSVLKIR